MLHVLLETNTQLAIHEMITSINYRKLSKLVTNKRRKLVATNVEGWTYASFGDG